MFKKLSWLLVILLALGLTVGCSDDDDDDDDTTGPTTTDYFEDMVAEGAAYFGAGTKNITGSGLYTGLGEGNTYFIIDLRSADHFNAGHIDVDFSETWDATIVNWAIADLMDNLGDIPADAIVVNVCYTGQTASQATAALRMLGYDAWNLKWGMCGWTSDTDINLGRWANLTAGEYALSTTETPLGSENDYPEVDLEVETVDDAFIAQLDAYFNAGTKNMSSADLFVTISDGDESNDPYIFNYWPPTFYNVGHVDGAVMFDSSVDQFKSLGLDALKYLPTDRQIVVYCWTGQTSSQITAYLNALGYDAYSLLYGINSIQSHDDMPGLYRDGTWYYAPDTDLPVTTEG